MKNVRSAIPSIVAATVAALATVVLIASAFGEQPTCTGNRHYDGVACCPTPPCPDPGPFSCPDPAPCPAVICDATTVVVDRCPEHPNLVPCRRRNDGTLRCPRPRSPRRVIVPETRIENGVGH